MCDIAEDRVEILKLYNYSNASSLDCKVPKVRVR